MVEIAASHITKSFECDGFTVLTVTINYPQVAGTGAADTRINRFYKHEAEKQLRASKNMLFAPACKDLRYRIENNIPFNPYEVLENFTVSLNSDCFLSLWRDIYTYTGGAHGNTLRKSETWSPESGWLFRLGQFFCRGTNYRKILILNAIEIASQREKCEYTDYFENYEKLIKQNFSPCNFYLTEEGIVIYYQQYEIAPYSEGIQEFIYSTNPCISTDNKQG